MRLTSNSTVENSRITNVLLRSMKSLALLWRFNLENYCGKLSVQQRKKLRRNWNKMQF